MTLAQLLAELSRRREARAWPRYSLTKRRGLIEGGRIRALLWHDGMAHGKREWARERTLSRPLCLVFCFNGVFFFFTVHKTGSFVLPAGVLAALLGTICKREGLAYQIATLFRTRFPPDDRHYDESSPGAHPMGLPAQESMRET